MDASTEWSHGVRLI